MAPNSTTKEVVILGEAGTGKTAFLYNQICAHLPTASEDNAHQQKPRMTLPDSGYDFEFTDISTTTLRDPNLHWPLFEAIFHAADAFILLYDISSEESFDRVTTDGYIACLTHRKDEAVVTDANGNEMKVPYMLGHRRFGCVVLGNKLDLVARREITAEEGDQWAHLQGYRGFEVDSRGGAQKEKDNGELVTEIMNALLKSILRGERRDREDVEKVRKMMEENGGDEEGVKDVKDTEVKKGSLKGVFKNVIKKLGV